MSSLSQTMTAVVVVMAVASTLVGAGYGSPQLT